MPSYLQIENISKSYGPKVLFENIAFNINEGDKIALVAPNGTGKTTLLRILAGKDKSDSGGKVLFLRHIRIAFLEQDYDFDPALSIEAQVQEHSRKALEGYSEEERQEFSIKLKEHLGNFGLHDPGRIMGELSGGEVKRVALSEMMALDADFLILDEPTNHLDIDAVEYLEAQLKKSRRTLLMVTHDRYFLDRVCNTILELDHGSVYCYKGDYQNYLEKRDERISNFNARSDKVRNVDGAWFRAFNYRNWDYWASDADSGWGSLSTLTGWIQSWIVTTQALMELNTSYWNLTAGSSVGPAETDIFKSMLE